MSASSSSHHVGKGFLQLHDGHRSEPRPEAIRACDINYSVVCAGQSPATDSSSSGGEVMEQRRAVLKNVVLDHLTVWLNARRAAAGRASAVLPASKPRTVDFCFAMALPLRLLHPVVMNWINEYLIRRHVCSVSTARDTATNPQLDFILDPPTRASAIHVVGSDTSSYYFSCGYDPLSISDPRVLQPLEGEVKYLFQVVEFWKRRSDYISKTDNPADMAPYSQEYVQTRILPSWRALPIQERAASAKAYCNAVRAALAAKAKIEHEELVHSRLVMPYGCNLWFSVAVNELNPELTSATIKRIVDSVVDTAYQYIYRHYLLVPKDDAVLKDVNKRPGDQGVSASTLLAHAPPLSTSPLRHQQKRSRPASDHVGERESDHPRRTQQKRMHPTDVVLNAATDDEEEEDSALARDPDHPRRRTHVDTPVE